MEGVHGELLTCQTRLSGIGFHFGLDFFYLMGWGLQVEGRGNCVLLCASLFGLESGLCLRIEMWQRQGVAQICFEDPRL